MSQPQNFCIYCGKPGRSKEHYWGKWLSRHLPPIASNTGHRVLRVDHETGQLAIKKGALARQGGFRRQQIKGPCAICNTGWMKSVNERAKTTIIELIERGPFALTDQQARDFATWATMLSMTYEFADTTTLVTPPPERRFLHDHHIPPADWAVMIGAFGGGAWTEIHNHRSLLRVSIETGIPNDLKAQTNVFTLGKTAVNTICRVTESEDHLRLYAANYGLQIVWPLVGNADSSLPLLSDDQLYRIAYMS